MRKHRGCMIKKLRWLLVCALLLLPSLGAEAATTRESYILPYSRGSYKVGYDTLGLNTSKIKSISWKVSDKSVAVVNPRKGNIGAAVVFMGSGTVKVTRTIRMKSGKKLKSVFTLRIYKKNSWIQDGEFLYYYLKEGGYAVDEWVGKRYVNTLGHWDSHFKKNDAGIRYRKDDGTYAVNEWIAAEDGNQYYFDSSTYMVTDTWIDGCYLQEDGKKKEGLVNTSEGIRLRVTASENTDTGSDDGSGSDTAAKEAGVSETEANGESSGSQAADGEESSGSTGTVTVSYLTDSWSTLNGRTVYFDSDGLCVKKQWKEIGGSYYYFNSSGYLVTSKWVDGYYVTETGARAYSQRVGNYYVGANGKKVTSRWIKGYYVNSKGKIQKNKWINGTYVGLNGKKISNFKYTTGSTAVNGKCLIGTSSQLKKLVSAAKTKIGNAYLWGGTGPVRYDCSGFVGYCYQTIGISLPRTTWYMYNSGVDIDPDDMSEWQVGDLLIRRGTADGSVTGHVMMYIGNGQVIQSTSDGGIQISYAEDCVFTRVKRILYVK
ncbi:MAG: NlpC/P60 family protein [Lachnospiraceae bacterium]|nr:NlpC/P60 family protein [Lachnospiraceae bacterium]